MSTATYNPATYDPELRELDFRASADGIDVALLWSTRTGSTFVRIHDRRLGAKPTLFEVSSDLAADAFRHPFAYLADQR